MQNLTITQNGALYLAQHRTSNRRFGFSSAYTSRTENNPQGIRRRLLFYRARRLPSNLTISPQIEIDNKSPSLGGRRERDCFLIRAMHDFGYVCSARNIQIYQSLLRLRLGPG